MWYSELGSDSVDVGGASCSAKGIELCLGFVFDLLSVLLPTVAAFWTLLPSGNSFDSMERVVMGDKHRYHHGTNKLETFSIRGFFLS